MRTRITEAIERHPARLVGFLALLVPLLTYNQTRARVWALDTLYAIDGAEMVLAAATLGVDHPPGHPLYLIIAHLFSALPFALPDEGVILTSTVFMALAASLIALCIHTRTRNIAVSVATGWTFAFGRVFWFHATIAEVYAVQLAGVGAVLYTLALWFRDRNLPVLYLACFLFGLTATSNVLLAVLLVPALIYALAVSLPLAQSGGRKAFGLCLTAAFLGLTPLAYVPLRVFGDGFVSDFVFLSGHEPFSARWLWWYFTAEEFTGSRMAVASVGHIRHLFSGFLLTLADNISFLIPVLSVVGLLSVCVDRFRKKSPDHLAEVVILGLLLTMTATLPYDVADKDVFFMPAFLFFILLGGLGTHRILGTQIFHRVPVWAINLAIPALPLALLVSHYGVVFATTQNTQPYELREARFRALPAGATIVSTDDGRATRYKYFGRVRGLRPDIRVETLGRLAPRFAGDSGPLQPISSSLNVADRLRVLKGMLAEAGDTPLFTILDDRMPTELDHFAIRRSVIDPRLILLQPKPPAVTSAEPIPILIRSDKDAFVPIDIVGLNLIGLDGGVTRVLYDENPLNVSATIGRSEFFTVTVIVQKRSTGHYFSEIAFVNDRLEIPTANGFTAARSLLVAPEDLPVGHYRAGRFTLKIPATIPAGDYTIVARLNQVTEAERGSYRGRPVRSLTSVEADLAWAGQRLYQPIAQIHLQ